MFRSGVDGLAYDSDALPGLWPEPIGNEGALFQSGSLGLVFAAGGLNITGTAGGPFTYLQGDLEYTWTHDSAAVDQDADPTVGVYAVAQSTFSMYGAEFQPVGDPDVVRISNPDSGSDGYQVNIGEHRIPASVVETLGLSATVSSAPAIDLSSYTSDIECGSASCVVQAYAICAATP